MRKTHLLTATLLLIASVPQVRAQVAPPLQPGSRVRITAPAYGLDAATGTVQMTENSTLAVTLDGSNTALLLNRNVVTALDVSVMRRRALRGMGVGALVGAGGGALIGLVSGDDPSNHFIRFTAEEKATFLAAFCGATGAVVGLIAGALDRTEVWMPATLPAAPPVGVAVVPFAGDGGAGVRVGFSVALR